MIDPSCCKILVIHRRVEHLLGNAASGGSPSLDRFYLPSCHCPFSNVVDEGFECSAQRHLHQPGVFHLSHKREDFCAGTFRTAGFGEPGWPAGHDGRDVVPGFDVVDVGGLSPQSFLCGERRPRSWSSGFAFQRCDQRRLFAANKRSRSFHQFDIKLESATEDVLPEQSIFPRLFDGAIQAMHRQRILGAHIDDSFGRAHHVTADDHSFQQRVRVAFNFVAIHVGAGVAFVCIADDVLLFCFCLGQEFPLVASGISGSAAAAQFRGLDLLDDAGRVRIDQYFVECLISADGDVFFNVVGIDDSAIPQNDFLLAFEERNVAPGGDFGVSLTVADMPRNVIPLFNLAVDKIRAEVAIGKVV